MVVDLPFALRRKEPFGEGRYMRQNMQAFVDALADPGILDEFILLMDKEPHVTKKFSELLEYRFNVGDRSFEELAMPILFFLTSPAFMHSPHTTDTKRILRLVFNSPLFYARMLTCLRDAAEAANDAFFQTLDKFVLLLLTTVKKVPKALEEDDFYDYHVSLTMWVRSLDHRAAPALARAEEILSLCHEWVPSRRPPTPTPHARFTLGNQTRAPPARVHAAPVEAQPSHDNAFEDFTNIRILPTNSEMSSLEPPMLPLHPKRTGATTMRAHIDFHFRLLREDALAQMKVGLQWYLNPATPPAERKKPPRHLNLPRLNVAEDVKMYTVKGSQRHGIVFEITAPQPEAGAKKANLRDFWARDPRYTVGSLVCLAMGVDWTTLPKAPDALIADMACKTMVFGTVAERDEAALCANKDLFRISIKLLNPKEIRPLVLMFAQGGHHVLLEVRGLFFTSVAPVLKSLQSPDLMTLPEELQACLYGGRAGERAWGTVPAYLRGLRALNLQFLVHEGRRADLRRVYAPSRAALVDVLEEHASDIKLDASQIEAFSAALTQQVCLIQGPPGTGKSYVGTKIVQALVGQPGLDVGPILCVCYTNHALDQFLEGLVVENIVAIKDMVRVGGRSKSDVLKQANIFTLRLATPLSRMEANRRYVAKSKCGELEASLAALQSDSKESNYLSWWKSAHADAYADICKLIVTSWSDESDPESEDGGFIEQNAKNKEAKRLEDWAAGKSNAHASKHSLWQWPAENRRELLEMWRSEYADELSTRHDRVFERYEDCVAKMKEITTASEKRLVLQAKIIGMTTTGCAMNQELVRCLAPKVVLIEEAGEVLEAHLLSCLTAATQHIIQIGDHQQLRPLVNEYPLSYESKRGHDLDMSMFERLVGTAHSGLVTLHTQRRMAPDICDLIRFPLYPRLADGPNVLDYPRVKGFQERLWFMDHTFPEAGDELSHQNPGEAALVVDLALHALVNGTQDIAILTPYLGQLALLRKRLDTKHVRLMVDEKDEEALRELELDADEEAAPKEGVVVKSLKQCVRLSTVDNFQGNEADLVFISTVRCNKMGSVGFLKVFNRVNVMLSRAKHGMFIFGSAATLEASRQATMFHKVLDILEHKQLMGPYVELRCELHGTKCRVANSADVQRLAPDGGCTERCSARLPCGHACAKLCHPDDLMHVTNKCLEACTRAVRVCGHLCQERCYAPCRCAIVVPSHRLSCGHDITNVRCAAIHDEARPLRCSAKVRVVMPRCQHVMELPCATAVKLDRARRANDAKELAVLADLCTIPCGGARDCGHACAHPCAACSKVLGHAGACTHPCDRGLVCGHSCAAHCHAADACPPCDRACATRCEHSACPQACCAPCTSCAEPCSWSCPHSGASCPLPCGSPCLRLPCDERCANVLDCGHRCPGLCGEPCLSSKHCRYCAADGDLREVVDLIMQTPLAAHDPEESPLVAWPCGHCFTVESMDGYLGLAEVFAADARTGKWSGIKPLTLQAMESQRKTCPLCRQPLFGVHRYARVLNLQSLYEAELKYFAEAQVVIKGSTMKRAAWQEKSSAAAQSWFKAMQIRCDVLAPSQEMSTKERHFLERSGFADLNLNRYRNTMQSKALTMLRLEAIEVGIACFESLVAAPKLKAAEREKKLVACLKNVTKLEREGRKLCDQVAAHRSHMDILLLGLKARFVALQSGSKPFADSQRPHLLREMHAAAAGVAAIPTATAADKAQAKEWCRMAETAGGLSKEEKQAIFAVFARDANGFNAGFGGHWYSCPNGHPYVITECGGAMQVAACPECGAAIGGSNHSLLGTNQTARAYFEG
ncbi:hypothetical protein ACHHYP_14331 [Achlya hypogyna]|uniref:RZ-type domain-containing protein n=1 Tax=Achlya hypogyna TaxID=1202772 RepID=A0A1V9YDC5_ACHHY|nr:hypothetical protein ACHHYP_14331 [Achlya hypogyna]